MRQINKNNYKQFLKNYNDFYHAYVKQIEYDTKKSEICIMFDIWGLEKPQKLKMVFKGIDKFNENNLHSINYIDYTYMDFYHQNGKRLICFSLNSEDQDVEPYLYITCENVEYEDIGDNA